MGKTIKKRGKSREEILESIDQLESIIFDIKNNLDFSIKDYKSLELKEVILEDVTKLNREQLIDKSVALIEENNIINKNIKILQNEIKRKKIEYKTSMAAFEKKFEILTSQLRFVIEKKIIIENENNKLKKDLILLSKKSDTSKKIYEQQIKNIRIDNENHIKEILKNQIKHQAVIDTDNAMNFNKINEYKKQIFQMQKKQSEFGQVFKEKINHLLSAQFEFIENTTKEEVMTNKPENNDQSENLNVLIQNFFESGDTKEKIVEKLKEKGYEEDFIKNIIEKIKK